MSKTPSYFVRLRGLPYSSTETDVRQFLDGLYVVDVMFMNTVDGRPAGECYCEFNNEADMTAAMTKHQETMGNRYIEVFPVGDVELERISRKRQARKMGVDIGTLRMRGLPFSCKKEDITNFFKDFNVEEIVFGKEPGEWGRPTGEAYVRFGSKQEAEEAFQLNGQHIGRRYIELFRVDPEVFETFKMRMASGAIPLNSFRSDPWVGYGGYEYDYDSYRGGGGGPVPGYSRQSGYRYAPYDYHGRASGPGYDNYRGGGGYYGGGGSYAGGGGSYGGGGLRQPQEFITPTKVQMRGIPFRITAKEIENFFAPLQCNEIKLGYFEDGRSTGDAIVEFSTMAEAREALKKDHESIGSRYIEIFPSNLMKLPNGAFYKTVGGQMPGASPNPAPLSSSRYQWPAY